MNPQDPSDETRLTSSNQRPRGEGGDDDATVPSMPAGGDQDSAAPTIPAGSAEEPSDQPTLIHAKSGDGQAGGGSSSDPLLGVELGGCLIEGLLGRGAMGAVYRARQVRLNREVAVKVMRPDLLSDQRMLKRFQSEARMVAQFQSPHVVMVHDVGMERGVHFLVMELVRGKNLRDYTKLLAGGRLPVSEALPLLRQACAGLEEAQRQGIIHRDIKPDNLMLTERGELKIADFGIAKPESDDLGLTLTQELVGTPLYMSPEQCQGAQDIDFRSDMYSLGATFYYLLTGEPPVQASSVYELIKTKTQIDFLALWEALPELAEDHPLSRVVARMTALDRGDRYETYEELSTDLLLVQQGRTMEIQRPPTRRAARGADREDSGSKTGGRGVAIGLVLALLAGGGGFYYWQQQSQQPTQLQPVVDNTGDPSPSKPPAAAAMLAELRQRLRTEGPSTELLAAVKVVQAGGDDAAARDALAASLSEALQVQQRCRELVVPEVLSVPFSTLEQLSEQIAGAHRLPPDADKDLATWARQSEAGMQAALAAAAGAGLEDAWRRWQLRRNEAGDDPELYAALEQDLNQLGEERSLALRLLPSYGEAIGLSEAALKNAAQGLKVAEPMVDVSAQLAELGARFALEGPKDSIKTGVRELKPVTEEDKARWQALLDEIGKSSELMMGAQTLIAARPSTPQLPFESVEVYYERVDALLNPSGQADEALPVWVRNKREELRDEAATSSAVLRAAQEQWARYQTDQAGSADLDSLDERLALLKDGLQRARRLFPDLNNELRRLTGEQGLAEAAATLSQRKAMLQLAKKAEDVVGDVEVIDSLKSYRKFGAALSKQLDELLVSLGAAGGGGDVRGRAARAQQLLSDWQRSDERVAAVCQALADGDLAGALEKAESWPGGELGREEFDAVGKVAEGCADTLTTLLADLDCGRARGRLDELAKQLERLGTGSGPGVRKISAWARAVGDLQDASVGMEKIKAGSTRFGKCAGFYMAPTEATVAHFEEFRAAASKLDAAELQQRLGAWAPPADELRRMLERRAVSRPEMPIEGVSHYAAAACAAWFGRALPSHAEWALAAFGDGHEHDYPWGGSEIRSMSRSLLAAATDGDSWRSRGRPRHLAGNVAEWLAADATSDTASLAGGSYRDVRRDQDRRAKGELEERVPRAMGRPAFGFREVLRPKDFLSQHFKDGRFPETNR